MVVHSSFTKTKPSPLPSLLFGVFLLFVLISRARALPTHDLPALSLDVLPDAVDEHDEVLDSTALVSTHGDHERVFCFKRDDHNAPARLRVRRKRYVIEGSYWGVRQISYSIRRAQLVLPEKVVRRVVRRAFDVWQTHSPLRFVFKPRGRADIEILFATGAHGDGEPFDGRGRVLAHAFFPRYGGDVHFDAAEHWSPNKHGAGLDLYAVAVHEIGHALGLKHSQEAAAIMAPFYQKYTGDSLHLHHDDILALRRLYGHKTNNNEKSDVSLHLQTHGPDPLPDICAEFRVDAVTHLANGSVFAFSGPFFYELQKNRFERAAARRIDEAWPGIEGPLDAVLTDFDGDSYFFKGDRYWLVSARGRVYPGYPKAISRGLTDLPRNLDAAFVWRHDDNAYFFKNDKYWRYSSAGMPSRYPKPVSSIFPHLRRPPQRIDAAVTMPNGDTFLFSGDHFYKLLPNKLIASPGYPRRTSLFWFDCRRSRSKMVENKRLVS